uniref:Uncharacterized mitochondrial protein AtMg00810-like n=1 Tax=Tanacetum cinerariifolium TaxID=118510 RepID=A0A6L2N7S1_TANCI|nr:uncharacterized mitochondrial protein AtMg00810-like [Tanacetum cinerariifolium]
MVEKSKLDEDKEGKAVNPSHYRGMIGTLLYLTANTPDLQLAICMCARYQAWPIEKHLHAVKRIYRYLRGTVSRGLWYPKDSSIALTAFTDTDDAGCQDTCRSTSVALDEALVSHASRLRIGKSNFRLRSDITSKESTLQVVYDVLRLTLLYKAFLVTTDTFDELPFEEEILAFLRNLAYSREIKKITDEDFIYQVEYKDTKKINEMHYPRFTKVIINFFMTKDPSIPKRNKMKLATKRSLQQTHISQASGSSKDKGTGIILGVLDVPTYESDKEISWKSSEDDDDDDDDDDDVDDQSNDDASHGMNVGGDEGPDAEDDDDELYGDLNINMEGQDVQMTDVHTTQVLEDTYVILTPVNPDGQQQSSFVSSQFVSNMLNPSPDACIDSLFKSTPRVDVPVTPTSDKLREEAQAENEDFLNKLDENIQKIIKEQVKEQVKVQVSKILPKIKKTINEQLEAKVLTRASNLSKTSYAVAADLSELELKKIIIEKIKSNKSIHRLDEQRNLYKALVDAYECDKIIRDTYGDTVTLKRRRDDEDKDEEPSAGLDRGSKRRRAGKEPESTSAPKEKASKTSGNDLAKQADFRTSFNELMDTPVDFSTFLMNRLKVDTLTPELLVGPTYELMKGSCKSVKSYQKKLNLTKSDTYRSDLKRKEAYTAYSNPRGFIYQNKDKQNWLMRIDELHKFSDDTLNDVQTALDDHLNGIRMKYLP